MQSTIETLKEISLPVLADALRKRTKTVQDRFIGAVKDILPDAEKLTLQDVLDDMPQTLELMIETFDAPPGRLPPKKMREEVATHATVRYHQNYNMDELLEELAILRRILIEEITAELGRSLNTDESIAVNLACDSIARKSVVTFVRYQKRQIAANTEAQAKHLSFLSHDLRGSLNGILLMIEVLRRDLSQRAEFTESIEDLEMMRRSILETVTAMDRFLYAERFRHGKVVLKPAKLDLSQLVSEVVTQFSYQARDKDLELKSELNGQTWPIVSDRAMINIILQNLIGNSVKFTRKGSVKITAERNNNGGTMVTVSDTGPGIPPAKLEELFAPFTRGETHGTEGMGLGLSIARQAADLLHAPLWADSEIGKGTQFHVELRDLAH